MEWFIIVFFLVGLFCGIYIGHSVGVSDCGVGILLGMRNHLQSLSDELEVHLQDSDFESELSRNVAMGKMESYYELMEYIDSNFEILNK